MLMLFVGLNRLLKANAAVYGHVICACCVCFLPVLVHRQMYGLSARYASSSITCLFVVNSWRGLMWAIMAKNRVKCFVSIKVNVAFTTFCI